MCTQNKTGTSDTTNLYSCEFGVRPTTNTLVHSIWYVFVFGFGSPDARMSCWCNGRGRYSIFTSTHSITAHTTHTPDVRVDSRDTSERRHLVVCGNITEKIIENVLIYVFCPLPRILWSAASAHIVSCYIMMHKR